MSIATGEASMTPDELLTLPNEGDFELVDGILKERSMSALSNWVGTKIVRLIGHLVDEQQLGSIFGPDAGFQCFGDDANTMRRPDVCFVRADRLPIDRIGDGYLRVVPDLVVEVISPNDVWDEGEEEIELFHRAGVALIWVVSPTSRTVRVLRGDGSLSLLRVGDELSGEGVIPGFTCPVASIFPPRPGPGPTA